MNKSLTKDSTMSTSMRNSLLLLASLLLAVLCGGCYTNDHVVNNDTIIGSGTIVSETRTPGSFIGIRVTGVAKVYITQDSTEFLRIEADDNIIGRVTTSVDQGVLLVGLAQGSYDNVTVKVYATMKNITLIEFTGSGSCVSMGPIQSDDLTCMITGTGSITLSGTAPRQTVLIAGAGSVQNFDLVSAQCSASIMGTGNIEVTVSQQLDAVVAGVGTITYAGNPTIVHETTSGVGSVRPRQ